MTPLPLSHRGHREAPLALRQSLRVRLPLVISALIVAGAVTLLWAAFHEVESTLVRAGGERAASAGTRVATLIERSSLSGMDNVHRAAASAELREYLRNPTDATREQARTRLAPLAVAGPRRVEVWTAGGARVLDIWVPSRSVAAAPPEPLPAATRPPAIGYSALQAADGVIFVDSAAEIAGGGTLAVRSTLSINPPGVLSRLVGDDAVVEIGNADSATWTDPSGILGPHPVNPGGRGFAEYRGTDGQMRLGAVSAIRATPWAVWVEFPRSLIVAPARVFLRRMILVTLIVVVIGALLTWQVTVWITRPLHELVKAAEDVAGGAYARRVAGSRGDEIGRVGRAFNAMVADIQDTHHQLETHALERSRTLEALRESEAHYRAIVEVALDCIITIDATGRVLEFNPAAEKTFGYRKADVMGRDIAEFLPPAQRDVHRSALARYAASGESRLTGQRIEMTAMRADGTEIPIEVAISAVPSDGPPMWTGVARDMTERKKAEDVRLQNEAIEGRNRRMLEANRLKGEFLANMSHELRTPLNAIIGFADLIHKGKAGPLSAPQEEYLGDILTSSRHLLHLINDVLDLAKVESGKMELRLELVELPALADGVRDVLRGLAASKGLHVDVLVDPALRAVVIDPVRVKQILYNYLSNAIKFTPPNGRVHVRITPEGLDYFRIDVEDTGIGIRAADLSKLFVEFEQLDTGTAKAYEGTGLGLALTKRLVEAHGGRTEVRSVIGEGSTFSAILPRTMRRASDSMSPFSGLLSSNRAVLVVDDDPAALKLAHIALTELGYRPICASTPEEGLRAAAADPPAVVIVDLLMPQMDGFEFISRLRAFPEGRNLPILVWTVKDVDAAERGRLQSSGASVVSKRAGGPHTLIEALSRLSPVPVGGPHGG